jgi:hypothetical protein
MKKFYICGVERLGYWIDERYLGYYSSWGSCGVVELPGVLGHCTSFVSGVACSLGLVEEGLVGLRPGVRRHELTDWLSNVRVGVTDQRLPIYKGKKLVGYRAEVVSVTDYYSFGAEISMRSYEAQPWYCYGYIEAHKDAPPSPVKLFVGSYRGTIRVVDDRTLELIVYNTTTPNSLFYHIGRYLSDRGIVSVRIHLGELLYPFFSFRPTEREYRFLINIEK